MKKDLAWKDNSNGKLLQYDFSPPSQWPEDRTAAEQAATLALLENLGLDGSSSKPGWLRLARGLPDALRIALIAELRAGNQLTSIGSTGWPSDGSIVVNMKKRFSAARYSPPPGVTWRELNDPHYCREELSQKVGLVEFLLIT